MNDRSHRCAAFGNPVDHSLSPDIHAMFAAQTNIALDYTRIAPPVDGFVNAAREFVASGGRGFNVTLPFKGEAARLVDTLDAAASAADAVNTVSVTTTGLAGFNTDGGGLVRDLQRRVGLTLDGASVAILGAGGATRGVLRPLLDAGVAKLMIANRTRSRADALASLDARILAVDAQSIDRVDLIVNATSAGLAGDETGGAAGVPTDTLSRAFCYDMMYGAATPFCRYALAAGATDVADGLGMLVEQAALAFAVWFSVVPESDPVYAAMRARVDATAALESDR